MNINFFATCIGDALKSRIARDFVLLLEELGCRVNFPEKQGYYGQSAIDSGCIREAIPGAKNPIAALEDNDDPVISLADSRAYTVKSYPTYLTDEPEWALHVEEVPTRIQDLTSSIANELDVADTGANLQGRAVCHPPCSLTRKLGVEEEPLTLLRDVRELELLTFADQDACCGFGGMFSVKMAEIPGEMVKGKALYLMDAKPEYLIDVDVSYLLNIGGRLQQEGQPVKAMHITEVLMNR